MDTRKTTIAVVALVAAVGGAWAFVPRGDRRRDGVREN